MGVIIHVRDKNVFRQGNRISKKPVYPMFLNEIKIINYEYIGELK